MRTSQLKELIRKAFDKVPFPGKISLHVAQAHDDYIYDKDAYYGKFDHRGQWQDIPAEHIENCPNALSYLEPDGLRYYLPAYMNLAYLYQSWSRSTSVFRNRECLKWAMSGHGRQRSGPKF